MFCYLELAEIALHSERLLGLVVPQNVQTSLLGDGQHLAVVGRPQAAPHVLAHSLTHTYIVRHIRVQNEQRPRLIDNEKLTINKKK